MEPVPAAMVATLETRVARIAEATMAEQRFVRPIDVLVGLGWLAQPNVERWKQGRVPALTRCVGVDEDKAAAAIEALQQWARYRELRPMEADYRRLQFTDDGDPEIERAYRIHWEQNELAGPASERPRLRARDNVVISPHNAWTCDACGEPGELLIKCKTGALCLGCADLGHLEFLPSGDAALTRRARKASRLSAVVVRWSTRRIRYERQGILAEPAAIERAAQECLSDTDTRAGRKQRDQGRRAEEDARFREEFAAAIRNQFPGCPAVRAEAIAWHAAARGSGRVGRSAAGRSLDPDAVYLAVAASVRHIDTDYDELLMSGHDRESARTQVHARVEDVLRAWRDGVVTLDE
ncbi:DUF2293 domain-containing protein [Mycolicibacterium sp. XJ662]